MPFRSSADRKQYQDEYDAKRRKTHRCIKVTSTLKEFRRLERYAKGFDLSVARSILRLALAKLDELPVMTPETRQALDEIIRLLRASGNNINQIAHACNLQTYFMDMPKTPQEGVEILSNIHQGLTQIEELITQKLA